MEYRLTPKGARSPRSSTPCATTARAGSAEDCDHRRSRRVGCSRRPSAPQPGRPAAQEAQGQVEGVGHPALEHAPQLLAAVLVEHLGDVGAREDRPRGVEVLHDDGELDVLLLDRRQAGLVEGPLIARLVGHARAAGPPGERARCAAADDRDDRAHEGGVDRPQAVEGRDRRDQAPAGAQDPEDLVGRPPRSPTCSSTRLATTQSKVRSGTFAMPCASPRRKMIGMSSGVRAWASATHSGLESMPTTIPSGPTVRAAARAAPPPTRSPGPARAPPPPRAPRRWGSRRAARPGCQGAPTASPRWPRGRARGPRGRSAWPGIR